MGSVPVDKAGVGSAVLNSGRQVGGSSGSPIMGAIVASSATGGPRDARGPAGVRHGFQHALEVAAAIALAGAVLSVATIRKYRHADPPVPVGRLTTARLPAEERRAALLETASGSSPRGATAARRRRRSPAPRASPSPSSIATSTRSATSTSRAWTRRG